MFRMADQSAGAYFFTSGPDTYTPTEHSGGAWRDDELHLAPVAGLLVHCLEQWRQQHADSTLQFSRISLEVLGQIAREPITIATEVIRPGRTIELLESTAVIAGRPTIRARAWLLQASETTQVEGSAFDTLPEPWDMPLRNSLNAEWRGGFIRSLLGRQRGEVEPGRGRVWLTSEYELVAGEPSSPLAHFARLLDSANGIAVRAQPTEWMYPNVDWTLHLFREPAGEWVGFDTKVSFGPTGLGLTSSVLHDLSGPVGTLNQSLTLRKL